MNNTIITNPVLINHNLDFMMAWAADMNNKQARVVFAVGVKESDGQPYMLALPQLPADKMLDFLRELVKAMERGGFDSYQKHF